MKESRVRNLSLLFALIFYKITIELIYYFVISPRFSYYGLTTDISVNKFIFSSIYLIIFYFSIPKIGDYVSTKIYTLLGTFMFIPSLVYYWMNSQSNIHIFVLTMCMIIISLIIRLKKIYVTDSIKYAREFLGFIFIVYILSSVGIIISQGGIDPRAFSFDTIYSLRAETELPAGIGYLLNWSVKAFTPFFFAYFYYKKKYSLVILVSIIQLFFYLTFGFKAYLFSVAFLMLFLLISRFKNFISIFIYIYSGINILVSLIYKIFNSSGMLDSISFRLVFVPVQSQFQYFDFFNTHPRVHFADGLIGKVFSIKSPYSLPVPNVISKEYFGNIFSQNTGVFGDAYGNGGFIAMIIIAVILGILLYTIDVTTKNIPKIITISAFSYMVFVLNDNSLLTAVLTGGFGMLILLFYLFNSELENNKINNLVFK